MLEIAAWYSAYNKICNGSRIYSGKYYILFCQEMSK